MRACSEVLTSGICEPGFLGDVFPIGFAVFIIGEIILMINSTGFLSYKLGSQLQSTEATALLT